MRPASKQTKVFLEVTTANSHVAYGDVAIFGSLGLRGLRGLRGPARAGARAADFAAASNLGPTVPCVIQRHTA